VQAVVVPGADGIDASRVDGSQHALIGQSGLSPVGGGVVVGEHLDYLPAPCPAVRFAVGPLALDAGALAAGVEEIRV
jgi:hypothetical protein